MAIVLTRRQVERFTPSRYGEGTDKPVYLVAPLMWRERAAWRADLVRAGAAYTSNQTMVEGVRASLLEIAPANLDELLGHVDAFRDLLAAEVLETPKGHGDDPPDPVETATFEAERDRRLAVQTAYQAVEDAAASFPRVSGLMAGRRMYLEIAPTLAAAHALRGWSEDVGVPFRRVGGVVPDDLIEMLPRADLEAIGILAIGLMAPTETERKN